MYITKHICTKYIVEYNEKDQINEKHAMLIKKRKLSMD